jgi:uncharacterized protein (DUF1015 family)
LADLHPFHGVRFDPEVVGDLAKVVSAPYDIIGPEAQRDYYARSPHNVIRLELGEERPADTPTENRYTRAAGQYADWLREGVLRVDADAGLYLYDEILGGEDRGIRRRSLIAPVRLARWEERIVLPHEYTLPKPKADRLDLLRATGVQFSPILAMYDDPGPVRALLEDVEGDEPLVDFSLPAGSVAAAASTHRLWEIADPARVVELVRGFAALPLYIADGHHRYETALAHRDARRREGAGPDAPSEFAMLALVETGDSGLQIWPTHRLLRDLDRTDVVGQLNRLREWFAIEDRRIQETDPPELRAEAETLLRRQGEGESPKRTSFVALGLNPGHATRLTLRPDVDLAAVLPDVPPVLRDVDVVLLQKLVLERALGFAPDEVEQGNRVSFSRDPGEAAAAYAHGRAEVVFFLHPTPVSQLRAVVRAGERLPQKTTYFYPKPVTGLVFFDERRAW